MRGESDVDGMELCSNDGTGWTWGSLSMPDWNDEQYRPMKELVERFLSSQNDREYAILESCLSDEIVMTREAAYRGKEPVIGWYRRMFSRTEHGAVAFELLDASAGFFSEDEAQVILYTELYQDGAKKELFIESANLRKEHGRWKISQLFGLSYEPEFHGKYFGKFLSYSD